MFTAPFSFEGRIRRTEYGLSMIIYAVVYGIIFGLSFITKVFFVLGIPLAWFVIAQAAKRCHDRGNSGWFQLIPLYGLWLLFGVGETGSNSFGDDPKNPGLEGQGVSGHSNILDSDVHA